FEQAKYPDRIRVGIFQQHNYSDTDCMDFDKILDCDMLPDDPLHPLCGRSWQIKIDCISYEHAKGSMYGRYRAEQFYAVEDYALQIDTHSLFVTDWDNIAIDMFKRKHKDFAIPKPRAMAWCNVDPPLCQNPMPALSPFAKPNNYPINACSNTVEDITLTISERACLDPFFCCWSFKYEFLKKKKRN
ncbi:hypothetical protein RFI_05183, partial [Reticulomyxa filosa]